MDPLLTTVGLKFLTRIAYWNITKMLESSKLAPVTYEMSNYKINILGLSETPWNGSGEHTPTTGELLLDSG